MAKKKSLSNEEFESLIANEQIIVRPMDKEMKESFISYSMMTLIDRAIPYIDGMKPVQRRILYDMYHLNLKPDTSYKKCARIVGDTIGLFHAHGDTSVYEALVNLVNDFDIRYPYVSGQGNFGSQDGDGAAAMRYTEAKLTKFGMLMLNEIGKNGVEMQLNYSEDEYEPVMLPSLPPAILLNGASGIATGYVTNIPSHNMHNVCDSIIAVLENSDITIKELVDKYLIGPDLPSHGYLIKTDDLLNLYETGDGKARFKAKIIIGQNEETGDDQIEIVELPPDVQKPKLIKKIYDLYIEKKDKRIIDVRDDSEGTGIRIVIELSKTAIPQDIIEEIYTNCSLIKDKSYKMRVVIDGKPQLLNLRQIIDAYCEHRRNVILRCTNTRLNEIGKKIELLNGLKIVIPNIEKVTKIIISSEDSESAKDDLMKNFNLTEVQANYILEKKLRSLNKKDVNKITKDINELVNEQNELQSIIKDESSLNKEIIKQMKFLKEEYGDDRKTKLITEEQDKKITAKIAKQSQSNEDMIMAYTSKKCFEALSVEDYDKMVKKGNYKIKSIVYDNFIKCKKDSEFVILLNDGQYIKTNYSTLVSKNIIGKNQEVNNYFLYNKNSTETILSISNDGYMKKTKLCSFTSKIGKISKYFNLNEGKKIIYSVAIEDADFEIINMATKLGKILRIGVNTLSTSGINASSKPCIKLDDNDELVDFKITNKNIEQNLIQFINCEDTNMIKVTKLDDFEIKGRNKKAITAYKLKKDNVCKKIEIVNNEFKFILNGKLQNANITDFEITAKGTKPIISDFEISKILK